MAVGERFDATPFDIENVFWSHRGELCTFDMMIEEFGLATPAAAAPGDDRARRRHRAARSAPEAPGLLAASLGLSRMYADDLEQLEAGMLLYDAFYRWCRDATERDPQLADQQGEAVMDARDRSKTAEADAGARHQLRRGVPRLAAGRRCSASAARPGRSR